MYCFAFAGSTGSGKTYNANILVSTFIASGAYTGYTVRDINLEYDSFEIPQAVKFKRLPTPSEYINFTGTRVNEIAIFEDATAVFNNKLVDNDTLRAFLNRVQAKRHYNMTYIFLFHALRAIPNYMEDFLDALFILNTSDTEPSVRRKFGVDSPIYEGFLDLRTKRDEYPIVAVPISPLGRKLLYKS